MSDGAYTKVVDMSEYRNSRDNSNVQEDKYSMMFPLVSDDVLYAAGFEAGQHWEIMQRFSKSELQRYAVIVRQINVEQIKHIAAYLSLTANNINDIGEGWFSVEITR